MILNSTTCNQCQDDNIKKYKACLADENIRFLKNVKDYFENESEDNFDFILANQTAHAEELYKLLDEE